MHFAAGYNRLGVVELLLQFGADVHAKDKGGLVPLHNACSYGHAKELTPERASVKPYITDHPEVGCVDDELQLHKQT
ncbi:unnamed protein product [Dibothriocephalus latus]|uniref:Uncharacterized protein n=1 Tax=Dibothriocephalus latus TaxID=60516 RepID=A0A3P7RI99_DIBLA|nr:unnamed protein product [Dibothriocephalus latus]